MSQGNQQKQAEKEVAAELEGEEGEVASGTRMMAAGGRKGGAGREKLEIEKPIVGAGQVFHVGVREIEMTYQEAPEEQPGQGEAEHQGGAPVQVALQGKPPKHGKKGEPSQKRKWNFFDLLASWKEKETLLDLRLPGSGIFWQPIRILTTEGIVPNAGRRLSFSWKQLLSIQS